jgi:8-oxo-dGTP pyrophosphatase MutT (NUDIX family)
VAASREFSAGGVVIRDNGGVIEVAVIKPHKRAVTALPKGHIDPGENAEQAATREVLEETGLTASLERKLGDVKYIYRWQGRTIFKVVSFFLFRHQSGEIDQLDPSMRDEVEVARWLPLAAAPAVLSYRGEREMVVLALRLLAAP